jgi:hypothetical protein
MTTMLVFSKESLNKLLLNVGTALKAITNKMLKLMYLFWNVFAMSDCGLELGGVCVARNVDEYLDVVGGGATLELRFGLDHDLDPRVCVTLNHRLDPDQRLYLE